MLSWTFYGNSFLCPGRPDSAPRSLFEPAILRERLPQSLRPGSSRKEREVSLPCRSLRSCAAGGRFRGFTLVELLVVLSVVAIRAALYTPVSVHIRARAHQYTLPGNLDQISHPVLMYIP